MTSTTEIDELPIVWAGLLERPFACGERVRRALRGQFGSKAGDQRFAVSSQIREDARLAHAERRAPAASDFPDAGNLWPEQLAVYRAAADSRRSSTTPSARRTTRSRGTRSCTRASASSMGSSATSSAIAGSPNSVQ